MFQVQPLPPLSGRPEPQPPAAQQVNGAMLQDQAVAYLWQHSETGRTRVVMPDQVVTVDASWHVVGPLVLATRPTAEPFGWMVTGGTTIYTGEYAEVDARCEAIHCGGTADAIPLYRHAAAAPGPVRQALSDEQITEMRLAGYLDADDYPDAWAYERGVRDAERAHGIGIAAGK